MKLDEEHFKKVGEAKAKVAIDAALVPQPAVETEVGAGSSNTKEAREEAVTAKPELNTLRTAAKVATNKHNVTYAKVRRELESKVEAWLEMFPKVHAKLTAEENKLLSEYDSAAARHYELLASTHPIIKARGKGKKTAIVTLVKLCKIYNEGCHVAVEAHVAGGGLSPRNSDLFDERLREHKFVAASYAGLVHRDCAIAKRVVRGLDGDQKSQHKSSVVGEDWR